MGRHRIYYGSPSNIGKARDQEEASQFKHPLMVKENWKVGLLRKAPSTTTCYEQVLAGRQKTHNNNILTLLNTANTAMLTVLPAF